MSKISQPKKPESNPGIQSRQFALVAACFLISGFAALLYETVWLRQFAILLGTSEQALAVVLASYMGGLAIGSLVASRVVDRIRRPLLTYGLLELGIAVSALMVPLGISIAYKLQTWMLGGQPEPPNAGSLLQGVFCFVAAFVLISIPTALMGATLPLLARHVVRSDEDLGPKIGLLYAINTAGAVIGTMVTAFVCLPRLGLGATTWVGVLSNFIVFLIVLAMVKGGVDLLHRPATDASDQKTNLVEKDTLKKVSSKKNKRNAKRNELPVDVSRYHWILAFAAVSGATSFCYEIVFTRMLGQMLGGSVFAFATMLSGFLLGIALGGGIASRLTKNRVTAATCFVYAQAAAAVCTLMTFHFVNRMVVWPWDDWGGVSATMVQVIASILALLPTSVCIGATFPLAIRVYADSPSQAATGSARVYFWNVMGGIIGAVVTGNLILPNLQYHGTAAFAIAINILIAVGVVFVLRLKYAHLAAVVIAVFILLVRFPSAPENVLRVSALTGQPTPGEMLFNHVGKSATVTVFENQQAIVFQTNGLKEASLRPKGVGDLFGQGGNWLSALPSMIRPEARSMLIIGLGGGVVAESVPPSISSIDVMELESSVVDANRAVADRRNNDPLSNSRIKIILNDARNALALTDKKYDVIVSQPSHPWTAGASHLYSREFDELIARHLEPGGVFLQWMNSAFIDVALTKSMGASLSSVFPHVRLYEPTPRVLMFVSSDQPMRPEMDSQVIAGQPVCRFNKQDRDLFQQLGIVTPTHLLSRLRLENDQLQKVCEGAPWITDERNLLAMRAPQLIGGDTPKRIADFMQTNLPVARGTNVAKKLCPSFDLNAYLTVMISEETKDWVRDVGTPLFSDPVERSKIQLHLLGAFGGTQDYLEKLPKVARQFPGDSDLAVTLLCNRLLGKPFEISAEQETELRDALNSDHQMIVNLLEKLVAGDLFAAKRQDAELASWSVDDVAYEWAVRLRIPWRLESPSSELVSRCNEAIKIIDQSTPFTNADGLAFFRVSAAVRANRPENALGTIAVLTDAIRTAILQKKTNEVSVKVPNLMRCYGILREPRLFRSASQSRYRKLLSSTAEVLRIARAL